MDWVKGRVWRRACRERERLYGWGAMRILERRAEGGILEMVRETEAEMAIKKLKLEA